jgi:hypothetical protein
MHCKDAIFDTDQPALATAACAGYQSKVLDGQTTSKAGQCEWEPLERVISSSCNKLLLLNPKKINSTHSSPAPDPHHRVIEETTPQLRPATLLLFSARIGYKSADPVHMMWHMAT